jgi:hypothetical protein
MSLKSEMEELAEVQSRKGKSGSDEATSVEPVLGDVRVREQRVSQASIIKDARRAATSNAIRNHWFPALRMSARV